MCVKLSLADSSSQCLNNVQRFIECLSISLSLCSCTTVVCNFLIQFHELLLFWFWHCCLAIDCWWRAHFSQIVSSFVLLLFFCIILCCWIKNSNMHKLTRCLWLLRSFQPVQFQRCVVPALMALSECALLLVRVCVWVFSLLNEAN